MRTAAVILLPLAALLAQQNTKSAVPVRVSKKAALIIGNSAYRHIPTVPPASADADDIASALTGLGFDVVVRKNLDRESVIQEISNFARTRVQPGGLALLYYSGHGGQIGEENYLLPIDYAPPSDDELADARAYKMSRVRDMLERTGARVRVMIFDACRNSPVTTAKSTGTGLREMSAKPEGTIIAYASGHNQVARFDTGERNSFYTAELVAALRQPDDDLEGLFKQVRGRVFERTGQKQTPYLYGFLSGPVYLAGEPPAVRIEAPAPSMRVDLAIEAWNGIKDSKDPVVFEKFAVMFPGHELAKVALLRLEALRPPARGEPVPAPRQRRTTPEGAVRIAQGRFMMGCSLSDKECYDHERPGKLVAITKSFWMKETEVTQAEYERAMGTNPSNFRGPNRPVENVDWNQAKAYCEREGGRLPTAAEWEYAARAGGTGPRHGDLDRIAWTVQNAKGETHDVRGLASNAWGLYDMLGNVREWTADDYGNGTKEVRGGSWNLNVRFLRASHRDSHEPSEKGSYLGFRCAWE